MSKRIAFCVGDIVRRLVLPLDAQAQVGTGTPIEIPSLQTSVCLGLLFGGCLSAIYLLYVALERLLRESEETPMVLGGPSSDVADTCGTDPDDETELS